MNDAPTIDTAQNCILTEIFTDIVGKRIPEFRDRHGVGSAVEENALVMYRAALDCAERCAALAAADPDMSAAFERRAQTVRDLIENVQAQRDVLLEVEVCIALAESKGQTKH